MCFLKSVSDVQVDSPPAEQTRRWFSYRDDVLKLLFRKSRDGLGVLASVGVT
jgi:hypothetical protein